MATVEEILKGATDSVDLINSINSNSIVQRNVEHLQIILAYEEIVADTSDKTPYTDAISTGQAYLEANG
jgi:hypothetical protein